MKRAAIFLAPLSLALAGCPDHTPETGGGGAGGTGGLVTHTGIAGQGGSGPCVPLHDNDPIACAPNKCTTTDDGCGGVLRCDTVCTSMNVPASCGKGADNDPACFTCTRTTVWDSLCESTPDRPYAYQCPWQYPQPGACIPKNYNADMGLYTACCGGPA